jgi:hypothetical protein
MRANERARWAGVSRKSFVFLMICSLLLGPSESRAYAVLAHEAIIDTAWETHVRPLLVKRYPNSTPEELKQAHGYAYGGAIIQDMGYYPHGSHFVSDLTHYVRSGDFIVALLQDAQNLNEYAFALGALSHYAADNDGHRIGTNRAVPVLYPKLEKKFGQFVTYEEDKLAHVKAEFGFDVLEVAKGRYAPDAYHDFIGFFVAERVLDQAFCETYGLDLDKVLEDEQKALGSYRRAVSKQIPKATRIAWVLKQDEIERDQPGITRRKFLYNLSRASYEKSWGKNYQQPKVGEKFLAFLWRLVPKFGPLKVLAFKTPTPSTEKMFQESFNSALDQYRSLVEREAQGKLALPNGNFDVGKITPPGEYQMNDEVHAKLLHELAKQNFISAGPDVRAELIGFYSHPDAPYATKDKKKEWERVQAEVAQLKAATPVEAVRKVTGGPQMPDGSAPIEPAKASSPLP